MNYILQGFNTNRKYIYIIFSILFFLMLFQPPDEAAIAEIQKNSGNLFFFAMMLFSFVIFLAILLFVAKFLQGQPLVKLITGRQSIDIQRVCFSFCVWGIIFLCSIIISHFLQIDTLKWNFQPEKFWKLLLLSLFLIPIQTSFEEIFFRGYLLQALALIAPYRWIPWVITSVLFGLAHIANPEVASLGYGVLFFYIGAGLLFGTFTLMDNGLELSLGAHAANNFFIALLVTSKDSIFQTPALFLQENISTLTALCIGQIFFYTLVLFIFAKKYNWHNWKEKLLGKI